MNLNIIKIANDDINVLKKRYGIITQENLSEFIKERRSHPFNKDIKLIIKDNNLEFLEFLKENDLVINNLNFDESDIKIKIENSEGLIYEDIQNFEILIKPSQENFLKENYLYNKINFTKLILQLKNIEIINKLKSVNNKDYFVYIENKQ